MLMNSKTGVALSIVAIAAVIALFASGPLAATKAQAFPGGFHRFGFGLRKRRHAILQALEVARQRGADYVGSGGEKLPELDIARAKPGQRRGEPRFRRPRGTPLQ